MGEGDQENVQQCITALAKVFGFLCSLFQTLSPLFCQAQPQLNLISTQTTELGLFVLSMHTLDALTRIVCYP